MRIAAQGVKRSAPGWRLTAKITPCGTENPCYLAPPMTRSSRRKFLKISGVAAGMAAASASAWVGFSNSRLARMTRQIAKDTLRNPAPPPVVPTPARWDDNQVTLTWIGHATVLINFYGVRILTDPAFSDRVGIDLGLLTLGPKRYVAPALAFAELPPVDLVLLSHAHMDHMDLPTLARLKSNQTVITARETSEILQPTRLTNVTELDWGETKTLRTAKGELRVEAFEVKHWGRRWPGDKPRGYNGYVLRREGRALIFGGDTALTPLFRNLRTAGPYAAALMPIGAYNPWIRNHCTPEEALRMADMAGAEWVAPIHHATFKLSDEPMHEPLERFQTAIAKERDRLVLKEVGGTATLT